MTVRPEIVQNYPFIDRWRANGYQYLVIPKGMLKYAPQFGLSIDEVVLHAILRDRTKLSFRNNWINSNGEVYIIFTREEASSYLGWSKRKTIDMFSNLVSAGLLTEETQKGGTLKKPKRLYVHQWAEPSVVHGVEELKNGGFWKYTQNNIFADTDPYYVLPKVFFEDDALKGLSVRAIVLYAIALDKLHLSIQYETIDENGLVWCMLDNEKVMEELGCSKNSLSAAYQELGKIGLMVRRKGGASGNSYRIYLRDYLPPPQTGVTPQPGAKNGDSQILHLEHSDFAPGTPKICTGNVQLLHPDKPEFAPGDGQNLHLSYPSSHPFSDNSFGDSFAAKAAEAVEKKKENYEFTKETIRYRLGYDQLKSHIKSSIPLSDQNIWLEILDICIDIITKDTVSTSTVIRVGKELVNKDTVLACYADIDMFTLYTTISKIPPLLPSIKNVEAYLHYTLLHAAADHFGEAYLTYPTEKI